MGMFNFNDVVSDIQEKAQEAVSTTANLSSSLWDEMKSTISKSATDLPADNGNPLEFLTNALYGATGVGGEANIPNPLRPAAEQLGQMGQQVRETAEAVRDGIKDTWSQLENLPGLSLGGKAEIEVNGKKYGVDLPKIEIENPMRDIREGAEDVYNQTRERAEETGKEIKQEVEKRYSELENIPDLTLGGGADIEVNGEKHRVDLPDLEVKNPLQDIREGAEQKQDEVEKKGEETKKRTEDSYDFLYNLPGVTVSGEGGEHTSEHRANFDQSVGADPFEGTEPSVNVYLRR